VSFYLPALIIAALVVLWLFRRLGDTVPLLVFIGVAALGVWGASSVPHSPVACLSGHGAPCGQQQAPWLIAVAIVIPGAAMLAYKKLRGDKRG
jgi:ABC-type Mn2+/Zn2+ transport system permease subunit